MKLSKLRRTGNTFSLSLPNDVQRADVSLTNQAAIIVYGNGGGDIAINARNLDISNSFLFDGKGASREGSATTNQ